MIIVLLSMFVLWYFAFTVDPCPILVAKNNNK